MDQGTFLDWIEDNAPAEVYAYALDLETAAATLDLTLQRVRRLYGSLADDVAQGFAFIALGD